MRLLQNCTLIPILLLLCITPLRTLGITGVIDRAGFGHSWPWKAPNPRFSSPRCSMLRVCRTLRPGLTVGWQGACEREGQDLNLVVRWRWWWWCHDHVRKLGSEDQPGGCMWGQREMRRLHLLCASFYTGHPLSILSSSPPRTLGVCIITFIYQKGNTQKDVSYPSLVTLLVSSRGRIQN